MAASTTKCFHITIENYSNNETIGYELVLLKGQAVHNNCCTQLVVSIKNKEHLINVKNTKFKQLIQLDQGENVIVFKSCRVLRNLTLNFAPRQATYSVLPLYIICEGHHGPFQAPAHEDNSIESALKRINLAAQLMQLIFAEKFHEIGLKRKTFHLESPRVFRSQSHYVNVRSMSQMELWYNFARELVTSPSLYSLNRKFLAFLSCTNYRGDQYEEGKNIFEITEAYVAFGGENLALLGTACLYTWPQRVEEVCERFQNDEKVDPSQFMDDSCFRNTLGGCFATTLGATLHELCHTFDLGHTEEGVMGRGFDNLQNEFLHDDDHKNPIQLKTIPFSCGVKLGFLPKLNAIPSRISWTRSCSFLLFYHKWFNSMDKTDFQLHFDQVSSLIKSTCGLRVVEIRRKMDELVLFDWIFTDRVLKHFFQLPVRLSYDFDVTVVVEDHVGNILKQDILCQR